MKQLVYDPNETAADYGYYHCPQCGSTFYSGGKTLHNEGCPTPGYDSCQYVIGPRAVQTVKQWALDYGEDDLVDIMGLSLHDIRSQLPHLF